MGGRGIGSLVVASIVCHYASRRITRRQAGPGSVYGPGRRAGAPASQLLHTAAARRCIHRRKDHTAGSTGRNPSSGRSTTRVRTTRSQPHGLDAQPQLGSHARRGRSTARTRHRGWVVHGLSGRGHILRHRGHILRHNRSCQRRRHLAIPRCRTGRRRTGRRHIGRRTSRCTRCVTSGAAYIGAGGQQVGGRANQLHGQHGHNRPPVQQQPEAAWKCRYGQQDQYLLHILCLLTKQSGGLLLGSRRLIIRFRLYGRGVDLARRRGGRDARLHFVNDSQLADRFGYCSYQAVETAG